MNNQTEACAIFRQPALIRLDTDAAAPAALNDSVMALQTPAVIMIDGVARLTADLCLPPGSTLAFGPAGRLSGAYRLTGQDTRIDANAGRDIFAPEVTLAGTWDAEFSPRWFGAVYDGHTDCTSAIQKCLDQRGAVRLCGCGTALITDTLFIHGNTWLSLDPSFTIRLADNTCRVMLSTRWANQRYFDDRFPEFVTDPAFPGFVSAADSPDNWNLGEPERNIRVTGGIWDANGGKNPRQTHLWGSYGYRGFLMTIVHVNGFVMRDTTLFDPATYFFDAALLSNFTIDNIHLDMRELRLNQDGIHLEGECHNGVISNIHGRTWDDMVALNGGDSWYPKYPAGVPVPQRGTGTNILWKSFLQGGISHVVIRDIHVSEGLTGFRAIRLLSTGAHKIDAITIDGIYGRYTIDGILISAHHQAVAPYGTIIIRNVACSIVGNPETTERDRRVLFRLENDKVQIDTLIIDGCRFRRTAENDQFLNARGSIRNLFVSNVDIGVAKDAPLFGRGALACTGAGNVAIEDAWFCNLSIHAEAGTRYDVAFQGNWRRLHVINARIEADTVFDLAPHPDTSIRETNNDFICDRLSAGSQGV
ncbi:MAG: hypothetical protein LC725_00560 [Lentisphaerae bacterium]|nr:hypothetical protein [Lentisphaerota bacterium]